MQITVKINNIKIQTNNSLTVLQLCENLNIQIPRFCYHENLNIAGNCRMCLVEIKNSIKPMVACSLPLVQHMEIFTNTPLVRKSRENVLEFLLLNHPLDCPICDQGGECDLQDQTMLYGSDTTKFTFLKRGVQNKNCGPFIKTIMTRCIHCTRCIRFSQNIGNNYELGIINRGASTEITTFLKNVFISELSGNLVDLCPVGALTFKPTAFRSRSWEITSTITKDCLNSLCPSIRVDSLNNKVVKILPIYNTDVQHSWLSDKTRFSIDGISTQRIQIPLLNTNNMLHKISWTECFEILGNKFLTVDKNQINVYVDNLLDLETTFSLKGFYSKLGIKNIFSLLPFNNSSIDYYNPVTLNTIKQIDFCLFLCCDLRAENILLDLLVKEIQLKNKCDIYTIGCQSNQLFKICKLSSNIDALIDILEGKHQICKMLLQSQNPLILVGSNFFKLKNNNKLLIFLQKYSRLNYIYKDLSTSNFIETNLRYTRKNSTNKKLIFLHNTQTLPKVNKKMFLVYQGTHFNSAAQQSNLILPSSTYFEKNSTYINILFKACQTKKTIKTNVPSDWLLIKIFILLYTKKKIVKTDQINKIKTLLPYLTNNLSVSFTKKSTVLMKFKIIIIQQPIQPFLKTYYLDNTITKASKLMALQTKNLLQKTKNFKIC